MLVLLALCITVASASQFFVKQMDVQTNILCPDEETSCPADHECCKLEGGNIGCCLQQGEAQKIKAVPLIKYPAVSKMSYTTSDTPCPSPGYSCSGNQTCCPASGSSLWGCCPQFDAVCCSDGKRCCPCGYTCGVGACVPNVVKIQRKKSVPFIPRHLAVPNALNSTNATPCPNPSFICPGDSTCCPSYSCNPWSCCSGSNAVCCSDGRHCCPSGYTCAGCNCVPVV